MRILDLITLALLIVGGLNWGLVGAFDFDLVSAIFGEGANETARSSAVSRVIYIVVALSALWQIKIFAELAGGQSFAPNVR